MSVRDVIQDILDRIVDEGDRAYLGSTNDVERLRAAIAPDEAVTVLIAREIQDTFFPAPCTRWETMSPDQRAEFTDLAETIVATVRISSPDPSTPIQGYGDSREGGRS